MGRQGRYIISSECQRGARAAHAIVGGGGRAGGGRGGRGGGGGGAGFGPLLSALAVLQAPGTEDSERRRSVRVRRSECYTIRRGGRRPSWCAASL